MKIYAGSNSEELGTITVSLEIAPVIYEDIMEAVSYDQKNRKYHTDINPDRIINGPLSEKHQILQQPVKDELDGFLRDCEFLIRETGFTIISKEHSATSDKSEYFIVFGIDGNPCGTLVYEVRISDHFADVAFPEEAKRKVYEYLRDANVLDSFGTINNIDFALEKVTVGSVKGDTWDKAYGRLYGTLLSMRRSVQIRNKRK